MRWIVVISGLLVGCTANVTPGTDASTGDDLAEMTDAHTDGDDAQIDFDAVSDAGPPPAYELLPTQPPTAMLPEVRGLRPVRGIIHSHSIHSHDACDGEPELEGGSPNEPCLDDFRAAICETKQDYVFLTEHEELAAFHEFEDLLLLRGDDEVVERGGSPIANRMHCPDGHRPLILPGGEFGTMPVGMTRHTGPFGETLAGEYDQITAAQVQAFRDVGAVVLQAHAESRERSELRDLGLDGFEVYQLHANVDPDIREDYLGLDAVGFLTAATPFIQGLGGAPDLVFLAFVEPNQPSLAHFDALVAEGQRLVGTAGTDCHQNALPIQMSDGERVDSYRRMMRWFSNWMLVDELTPEALTGALKDGRLFFAFEIFGTPEGFDFRAEAGGDVYEIGDEAPLADAPELVVSQPEVLGFGPVQSTQHILRIEQGGAVEVAGGEGEVRYQPDAPGAYRAVVRIVPTHLAPHLEENRKELAEDEYEWIWANPIYVE